MHFVADQQFSFFSNTQQYLTRSYDDQESLKTRLKSTCLVPPLVNVFDGIEWFESLYNIDTLQTLSVSTGCLRCLSVDKKLVSQRKTSASPWPLSSFTCYKTFSMTALIKSVPFIKQNHTTISAKIRLTWTKRLLNALNFYLNMRIYQEAHCCMVRSLCIDRYA